MTTTEANTATATRSDAAPRKGRKRLDSPAVAAVQAVLESQNDLQSRYLREDSRARAELAHLRKGAGRQPGEDPAIWHLTSLEVPPYVGDSPTREEIAVHTALTLYAIHQQSKDAPMHQRGRGLGHAARALVGTGEEANESFRKRFNALVTSSTITELRHHLRTFVSLLRSHEIPLDYALLTGDVVQFQRPGGASTVRLHWAREFAALSSLTPSAASSPSAPTTEMEN